MKKVVNAILAALVIGFMSSCSQSLSSTDVNEYESVFLEQDIDGQRDIPEISRFIYSHGGSGDNGNTSGISGGF